MVMFKSIILNRIDYHDFSIILKCDRCRLSVLIVGPEQSRRLWPRRRDNVALFQVCPHVAALAEAQAALVARVWFDSCVVVHVRL